MAPRARAPRPGAIRERELLTREAFNSAVFGRAKGRCIFCTEAAVNAHHILDRKPSVWVARTIERRTPTGIRHAPGQRLTITAAQSPAKSGSDSCHHRAARSRYYPST